MITASKTDAPAHTAIVQSEPATIWERMPREDIEDIGLVFVFGFFVSLAFAALVALWPARKDKSAGKATPTQPDRTAPPAL